MIKIAYNKEKPNLVYEIDKIEREGMSSGIVEKYVGTLKNTDDNTESKNVKIAVVGFDAYWEEVPNNVVNTGTEINNQNKEVTPTTSVQNIKADAGYTGLGTVKVNGAPLETAEVTLSTSAQTITATGEGKIGLSSVSVPAVTASIDANIVAGNIKKDVEILGVTGTYEGSSPVPEKVALNLEDSYTSIHFITEGYSTVVSNELLAKIEEIIKEVVDYGYNIERNTTDVFTITPDGDSVSGALYVRLYDPEHQNFVLLNEYEITVGADNTVTITINDSYTAAIIDQTTVKQGTTPYKLASSSEAFDIDILNLIAYAYADEVVTPTPTVGE